MKLGLLKLSKHVLALTIFDALWQLRKYSRVSSDSSALKSSVYNIKHYKFLNLCQDNQKSICHNVM